MVRNSSFQECGLITYMFTVITIIRVSVMFNQRKKTSRILFFLYSIVTVNTIVFTAYWYGPQSGTYPNIYDDILLCDESTSHIYSSSLRARDVLRCHIWP